MGRSKRPAPMNREVREQLEGHLDGLIESGDVSLPQGKRIRLTREGVPKVIETPDPIVSKKTITRVFKQIEEYELTQSIEWGAFETDLNIHLEGYEGEVRDFTHAHLLELIEEVNDLVVEDFETVVNLHKELMKSPSHIKDAKYLDVIPLVVSRMFHKAPPRDSTMDNDKHQVEDTLIGLEKDHRGIFVLIDTVRQLHCRARGNRDLQTHLGELAEQCLETLVAALDSKNPRWNMCGTTFRSLKNRVEEIANGNREASPEAEDEVKDEAELEDDTEDDTEDGGEA